MRELEAKGQLARALLYFLQFVVDEDTLKRVVDEADLKMLGSRGEEAGDLDTLRWIITRKLG